MTRHTSQRPKTTGAQRGLWQHEASTIAPHNFQVCQEGGVAAKQDQLGGGRAAARLCNLSDPALLAQLRKQRNQKRPNLTYAYVRREHAACSLSRHQCSLLPPCVRKRRTRAQLCWRPASLPLRSWGGGDLGAEAEDVAATRAQRDGKDAQGHRAGPAPGERGPSPQFWAGEM